MVKTLLLASFAASAMALAPQTAGPVKTAPVVEGRRAFVTQVGAAMAAGVLAPGAAFADGAVSTATVARSRGIYGGRIADLKGAVEKGDFAAVLEEKNAFELFNSGAYMKKTSKDKKEKPIAIAEYNNILAAAKAGDKAALQKSYAAFMKNADIDTKSVDVATGQGYSTEYDWKARSSTKGAIYQR